MAIFFKFINNSWEHIYTYINFTDSLGHNQKRLWPFQVGNEFLSVGYDGIYKFNGNFYIRILKIENFQPQIGCGISGSGSNNLLITGFEVNHSVFFNWNGKKWSKEYTLSAVNCYDIKYSKDCYIAISYYIIGFSDFLKFTKKNKDKNNENNN